MIRLLLISWIGILVAQYSKNSYQLSVISCLRSEKSSKSQISTTQSLFLVLGSWFCNQLSVISCLRYEVWGLKKAVNLKLAPHSLCSWFLVPDSVISCLLSVVWSLRSEVLFWNEAESISILYTQYSILYTLYSILSITFAIQY